MFFRYLRQKIRIVFWVVLLGWIFLEFAEFNPAGVASLKSLLIAGGPVLLMVVGIGLAIKSAFKR